MDKKISVIVPVYKVKKYLPRCIESILEQTYANFELILVDDGSPDCSGQICDAYAQKDDRIRVIHKKNGGVSSARNAGIDVAKGEYISFIDSDDWVSNDYLEKLILPVQEHDAQLVVGGIDTRQLDIREERLKNITLDFRKITKDEFCWFFIYSPAVSRSPWSKLYQNQIIQANKIRFNIKQGWGEDTIFFYQYCSCISQIHFVKGVFYHYNRLVEGSATKTSDRIKLKFGQMIQTQFEQMIEVFGLSFEEKNQIVQEYKIGTFFNGVREICSTEDNTLEDIKEFYDKLKPWDLQGNESTVQEVVALKHGNMEKIFEIFQYRKHPFLKRLLKYLYINIIQKTKVFYIERRRDGLKRFRRGK